MLSNDKLALHVESFYKGHDVGDQLSYFSARRMGQLKDAQWAGVVKDIMDLFPGDMQVKTGIKIALRSHNIDLDAMLSYEMEDGEAHASTETITFGGKEYPILNQEKRLGVLWYEIEDEPGHFDWVKAE